jgi:putative CocE/NonD family hydrolase
MEYYSAETFEVTAERGRRVRTRDGIRLSVGVYRPAGKDRYPGILIHTPYNNNNNAGLVQRAKWFARRGYAVALSDVRGRYDSEGDWDPFDRRHKTDGHDLVEWLSRRPWCHGKVGMVGSSYLGWTQWWTATQAPPALKAIAPEVAPPDQFANAPYQEGVLVGWMMDWAAIAGRTAQVVGERPYGGFTKTRAEDLMRTPYARLNERRGALDSPWFDTWLRHNLATAEYWRDIAYHGEEHYRKITVPPLNVTGWFDANFPDSPRNYQRVKRYGASAAARRPTLVIGPWPHGFNQSSRVGAFDYGPAARLDWDGYVCRWFDHFLKGVDNGVEKDPPVHVVVMGRNRWRAERDWPLPQTLWTKYYLHSGGKANSLQGEGALSTAAPGDEPADGYSYDPARPTRAPFTGGDLEDGAVDTRKPAGGDEVLVYSTPTLAEDVEVVGPVEAKLFAATSARDTDWMVRLIDVQPDGYAALLCDGVIRARCRDPKNGGAFTAERLSEIEPGKAYEYTIRFWRATGNLFKKGHRIPVEVSSSYYPYYMRNLNTGADNIALETEAVVAKQKVYHDAAHPSHVVLPIIPQRD